MNLSAPIAYAGRSVARPRYHANDTSRDVLDIAPVAMAITDARQTCPTLEGTGFTLAGHRSAVADFTDSVAVNSVHRAEIVALITELSGADQVLVNSPGVLRFSEKSAQSGQLNNSRPARFAHVDISDSTAAAFARRAAPPGALRAFQRLARDVDAAAGCTADGLRRPQRGRRGPDCG